MATSNQHTYGNSDMNTANHFEEIVKAYHVFVAAGLEVDFVSPNGGAIPIGYINTSDPIQKQYIYDPKLMGKLKTTMTADEVVDKKYAAVYYSGGGAAMFGVPESKNIISIAETIYANGGVVSAVCHGTAGLVHIKDDSGAFLFKGKKITGFPDAFERMDADYYKTFPFSIEQKINERGGIFEYSEEGWDGYYVVDGRLITGQDPTSTTIVAEKVVAFILEKQ